MYSFTQNNDDYLINDYFSLLIQAARQHLERLPRRPHPVSSSSSAGANGSINVGGNGTSNLSTSNTQQAGSSIANSGRDITITSNPLLLAAAAAAASSSSSSIGGGTGVSGSGSSTNGLVGFGTSANNIAMSALQPHSHLLPTLTTHTQSLLNRFMHPILDDADLAQLERNRAERYVFKHTFYVIKPNK